MEKAIKESQKEYFNLVKKHNNIFRYDNSSRLNVLYLLDEINVFWLKRLEIIEYELSILTQEKHCFILSGAVYLNVRKSEHFYFKTFGDYHILHDPFLKMENAVRFNNELNEKTMRYLCDIHEDTKRILEEFNEELFILPIERIAWISNYDDRQKIIEKIFWQIISSLFSKAINNTEEFQTRYDGYLSIEKDLDQNVLTNLIFTDSYDSKISIKERVDRYLNETAHILDVANGKGEAETFLSLVYIHIAQIMDILLTTSKVGMIPFIRYEVPFRYLCLLMGNFTEIHDIRNNIEKIVLFYIFYKSINVEDFKKIDFNLYCNTMRNINFLDLVLSRIKELEIDFMKTETTRLKDIIVEEYKRLPLFVQS